MRKKDVGYLIKNINDKLSIKADADLKNFNLTFTQSRVLVFLNKKGGSATQKEIETFLEVSHPTVVGIVSRMKQKGHVITWIDESDRRNKIVKLSEQAEVMGKDLEQNIHNNERKMLSSLSPKEIEDLRRMLNVIYKNLE
ncbi:MarR family winged helix-turn-helix transcriptional regulator [Porcipelethomonas sp.]|uniref:MarR family winged helix-turn-helix transcriptional regulator n=1 Tax=Porcipelethomonas sp. TaxID=2981675 RepID=UPI003EF7A405